MSEAARSWRSVWEQTFAILRTVEQNCGAYNLTINGIPIWWFARDNFVTRLTAFLGRSTPAVEMILSGVERKGVLSYRRVISKYGLVFLARCVVGAVRLVAAKTRHPSILFVSHPRDLRRDRNRNWTHTYYGELLKRIGQRAAIAERVAFDENGCTSLLHGKDRVFMDWAMAWAVLNYETDRWSSKKLVGWDDFLSRCRCCHFDGISSEGVIEFAKHSIDMLRRMAAIKVSMARLILRHLAPEIVLVTHYDSDPKAFIFAAKEMGIPTVELQHGVMGYGPGYTYFIPDDYEGPRVIPDRLFVFGEAFRDELLSGRRGNGFSEEQIVVTGFPMLSAVARDAQLRRDAIRREVRTRLGVPEDVFMVTVTLSGFPGYREAEFLRFLAQVIERTKDVVVSIKLHPSSGSGRALPLEQLARHSRVRIVPDRDVNLHNLLIASDLHATVYSTVLLEALALDVPNVIVKLSYYQSVLRYGDRSYDHACVHVETPEEFVMQVQRVRREAAYRDELISRGREPARAVFHMVEPPDQVMTRKIRETINASTPRH